MVSIVPIVLMLTFITTLTVVHGKGNNGCESTEELKFCEKQCKDDPDCNEDTNLSCNAKCKEACGILDEQFGSRERTCKQVLHATIQYNRKPDIVPKDARGYYTEEKKRRDD